MADGYLVTISVLHMDEYYTTDRWPQLGDKVMMTPTEQTPGGSVANASSVCAALGGQVYFYDVMSPSQTNKWLLNNMKKHNINTEYVNFVEDMKESKCLIIVTGEEKTILCIMPPKPAVNLNEKQTLLFRNASLIYTMLGAERIIPDAEIQFADFQSHGAKVALDVEFKCESESQRKFMEHANILFFNQFGFRENRKEMQEEEYLNYLLEQGVEIVIVTLGKDGCLVRTCNERIRMSVYEIEVVDTNGAGDTFNASFLYGLQNEWGIYETTRFATAAANYCVTMKGPRGGAVGVDVIRKFMKENQLKTTPIS